MTFRTLLFSAVVATCATTASAQVTVLTDLSTPTSDDSCATYTISNNRGAIYAESTSATECTKTTSVDATNTLHQWVLIPSTIYTSTPSYYFYNVGAGKFLSYNQSSYKATLTEASSLSLDNCFKVESFERTESSVKGHFKISSATSPSWFFAFSGGFSNGKAMGFTASSNFSDAGASINFTQATTGYSDKTAYNAVTTFETNKKTSIDQQISALQTKVGENVGQIGYPTAAAYATVTSAETYEAKISALNSVLLKANIVLPTDGKAYYIRPVNKGVDISAATYYLCTNASGKLHFTTSPTSSAIFYAHKKGGKFVFTNSAGKYLTFRADGKTIAEQSNGTLDSYSACCMFSVLPFYFSGTGESCSNSNVTSATTEYLGLVLMQASMTGSADNHTSNLNYLMLNTSQASNDNPFHNGSDGTIIYTTGGNTCAFAFQEATQENTFQPTQMTIGGETVYLGTYSSPFPVVLPDGLTAYKVSATETAATLIPVGSQNIPGGQGFIVKASSADAVIPVARTDEELATVENNMLSASTGAALGSDVNAYVLGYDSNRAANFYKLSADDRTIKLYKSYLILPTTEGAAKMELNFGGVTGINAAAAIDSNAPKAAYDLSGRRVNRLSRGLYIVNGKKVMVK